MKYKIGDLISFVDFNGKGYVKDILGWEIYKVFIEDDGMEYTISGSKIVKINLFEGFNEISFDQLEGINKEIGISNTSNNILPNKIDLHYEKLPKEFRFSKSNLECQMAYYRASLEEAISKKIKELLIIHGQGKGVLKNEIIKDVQSRGYTYIDNERDLRKKGGSLKIFIQ